MLLLADGSFTVAPGWGLLVWTLVPVLVAVGVLVVAVLRSRGGAPPDA